MSIVFTIVNGREFPITACKPCTFSANRCIPEGQPCHGIPMRGSRWIHTFYGEEIV